MMKKNLIVLAIGLASFGAQAAETLNGTLVKRIEQRVGAGQVVSITPTKYSDLLEVQLKRGMVYADKTGKYLFDGKIIDADSGTNLTEERFNEINRIDFKDLPLDLAIKFTKGNGQRVIAVFEDPNCGYCRQLRRTFAEMDNITVYTFLLNIISPDSKEKSRDIWCSSDRNKAWDEWMLQNKTPAKADATCVGVHDKVLELGIKYRIQATPTIVFKNGKRIPGAINAKQFEEQFATIK